MPLSNVFSFGGSASDDPAPIAAELIGNIAQILAEGDAAAGTYSVDEVLTGIVYAMRRLELEVVHTNEVLATLLRNRGQAEGGS